MMSYQRPRFWERSWFAALIGGLGVGAGVWWLQQNHGDEDGVQVVSSAPAGALQSAEGRGRDPSVAPTVLPDGRPSDFSPQDWAALKQAMARTPNAKAEMDRIVSYLRFQRNFDRWQALSDAPEAPERRALAESLLGQLPQRLRTNEVTMGEALLVAAALVRDLEPDEHRREQRFETIRQRLVAAAPRPGSDQADRQAQLLTEYKRRQAAIVAEWQSRPQASRDQAQLEKDLEEARRAVYGLQR